ncbi:hypothetical protein PCANC_01796 [Puccinia coronata f. sp. avenae]|uniref:Uncharacterized protein n=1 Tax=Puccinia coronata f. sp. avenae TaxID=200324 RepID=A0A2N5W578_9BASI|nr:hypothetical protein PCANC_01796 [Puccinia coronata f. sp. avenae]
MPPPASLHPPPGGGGARLFGVSAPSAAAEAQAALGRKPWGLHPLGPRTHSRRDLACSHFELGQQLEQRQPDHRHQAGPSTSSRTIDIKPDHRHQAGPSTSSRTIDIKPIRTRFNVGRRRAASLRNADAHTRLTELYKQPMNPLIRPSVSRARQRLDEDWFGWRDETTRSCRSSHAG